MSKLFSLENKTIVVTGATGQLGSVIATALAAAGAEVISVGRDSQKLISLRNKLKNFGGENYPICKIDFSSTIEVKRSITDLLNRHQEVDGLVHCAISRPSQLSLDNSELTFKSAVEENAIGTFFLWERFSELMSKKGGGSLVYIGSIFGVVSPDFKIYEDTNMGTEPDYMFLKSGMLGLSRYYANKYGESKVRSNVITLGGIEAAQPEVFKVRYAKKTSLKRMATPADVVGPCIFLLSTASEYVTATELVVDGGYLSL